MTKKKRTTDITKPNSLAEARGFMSKAYLDILDISLHIIAKGEEDPKKLEYDIKVSDYAGKLGIGHTDNAYRLFKKYRTEIKNSNKAVTIDVNGVDTDVWIFQSVGYDNGNGIVKVKFTEDFKEYLVKRLEERGKKVYYSVAETLPMKSEYSKRFYPILLERVHKKPDDRMKLSAEGSLKGKEFDRIDSIEGFRSLLAIPESYGTKNVKDVCNTIMQEIETFAPFKATVFYNEVKGSKGRYPKITHICWTMEEITADQDPAELKRSEETKQLYLYLKNSGIEATEKEISIIYRIAEKGGLDLIEMIKRVDYVLKMEDVDNYIAYIVSIMKLEDFQEKVARKPKSHLELFGFEAREYDFEKLEQMLLDY